MEEEKDAFYVVRKGDIIGIYKSFSDCQAQVGSSVCDPSVSVFKGYGLTKEAEEHLLSHGLRDAAYAVSAVHVQNDLLGKLTPCLFQGNIIGEGFPTQEITSSYGSSAPAQKKATTSNEADRTPIASKSTAGGGRSKKKAEMKEKLKKLLKLNIRKHVVLKSELMLALAALQD